MFITVGLFLLVAGMTWGVIGGFQYIVPGFMKKYLSFEKVRPLHVSSVVFWIILAAIGGVLNYVQEHTGKKLYSTKLAAIQLWMFVTGIGAILISYCFGIFGGREYWEFHPILALPIVSGWLLFIINLAKTIGWPRRQPVYIWMWLTGATFFLFTFLESYLWLIPWFRRNIVNDMTIQWKSYGSMVGAWNMLIYGCSIFLMDKISGNKKGSTSGVAFALYFTGLFNLMFNWGHHIYTLPTHSYVKHIGYAVSMTELVLLARIIFLWKQSLSTAKKNFHHAQYRFMAAADLWIFLTLTLAIAMSVPGINLYTHGTHVTVAHTMGATIGINSFLLLAIAFDILHNTCRSFSPYLRLFNRGFWISNVSLLIFWISLIGAGVMKSRWQMSADQVPFSAMMAQLRPFFVVFLLSGITLAIGISMVVYPLVKNQLACIFSGQSNRSERITLRYANTA